MERTRTIQRVLAGAVAATALAAPALALAGGSAKDAVKGNGSLASPNGQPDNTFHYTVQGGPDGEGFKGEARYTAKRVDGPGICDPGCKFTADVTCLRVEGNRASMVGRFRKATNQPERFDGVVIFVEDNGKARGQAAPLDREQNRRLTAAEVDAMGNNCPTPIRPVRPISDGDITVDGG